VYSEEENILTESFLKSKDREGIIDSLRYVLDHKTPFALYIATLDRSNTMWIFDPDMIYDMLGGEDIHSKTFRTLFPNITDRQTGVLFYVLDKISPATVVRVELKTLCGVIKKLNSDIS
jgi:hypothetical protein